MPKTPPPDYLTSRRWAISHARAALAALAASGLSTPAFADREGLDVERLRRWRRALSGRAIGPAAVPGFVEVRSRSPQIVEVVLRSGRVLRVPESVDVDALGRIVEALDAGTSC